MIALIGQRMAVGKLQETLASHLRARCMHSFCTLTTYCLVVKLRIRGQSIFYHTWRKLLTACHFWRFKQLSVPDNLNHVLPDVEEGKNTLVMHIS